MTIVTFIEKMNVSIPSFRFVHVKRGERMAVSICTLLAFLANVYSNSSVGKTLQAAPFCGTYNYGIFVEGGTRRF